MARYFRKKKFSKKSIIALVVAAIIIVGAICGIAFAINNANAERKTLSLSYSVGGLTETGAYKASETSIYTKSAFVCDGLEIDIVDDPDVGFEVFYYGKTGAFISSTGIMKKDYVAKLENGENSARIVITPNFVQPIEDEDIKGFASQLVVSVSNVQTVVEEKEELLYFNLRNKNATVGAGPLGEDLSVPIEVDGSGYAVSDLITIDSSKMYVLTVSKENPNVSKDLMDNSSVQDCLVLIICFYDAAGNPIEVTYTVSGETYTEEQYQVYNLSSLWDWSESCWTYEFGFDGNSGFELSDTPAYMVVNATSDLLNYTIPSLTVK